jgi:E3 ubiquitin-protein ligase MARCH6
MEWLSHSQKKHCELCKTPFRFTKLYDPNMPTALPPLVFVSHTAKYIVRNLLVWMRAGLVASVWLGWLPYLMRSVWSFLFWISDEGLGGRSALFAMLNGTGGDGLDGLPLHGANMCPSSPLFAATTTVATIGGVIDNLSPESAKFIRTLYGINLTSSDPIYSTVLRLLFGTVGLTEKPGAMMPNATATLGKVASDLPSHQTLLSGVGFLRNLTRHATVNRVVIAVLEGQIITILVIVCFILIILVRDYVVQQQPEINMRAAFAAIDNPAPAPAQEGAEPAQHFDPQEEPFEHGSDASDDETDSLPDVEEVDDEAPGQQVQVFPRLGRQGSDMSFAESSTRRALAPIFESGRALPDPADMQDFERTSVHEYLGIYREAGGDPERILKIAKERHLEDKLDYWIRLTRSMVDRSVRAEGESSGPSNSAGPSTSRREEAKFTVENFRAPDITEGERVAPQNDADSKGKGRLSEDYEERESYEFAGPSRPRANTDGPKISDTINPLANNNWSFEDFPPANPELMFPESLFPLDERVHAQPRPVPWDSISADSDSPSDSARPLTPRPATPESSGAEEFHQTRPDEQTEQGPVPQPQPEEARPPRREPQGLVDRVADFMWRDVEDIDPDELAPVNILGDFVNNDVEDPDDEELAEEERDREAVEAAVAAGLDPEAIEDAEDLEGILELLGMRGPVAGLFQNAIFCAFLVSITIFVGVFLPYNMGRIAVWTVANPVRPARMLFSLSKFIQDCALVVLGLASSTVSEVIHILSRAFMLKPVAEYTLRTASASWAMAISAANRIGGSFLTEMPIISTSEMRNFSAISHEALLAIKEHIASALSALWQLLAFVLGGDYSAKGPEAFAVAANVSAMAWEGLKEVPTVVANPSSWVLNLSLPETTGAFKPELAYWDGTDRFWAILAGYITLSIIAGIYLRRGSLFSTGQAAQEWEASIIDGLNQASGVMKVILIIGIEMLVFPLYCGMLLDVALLPLFENTTLKSRVVFAAHYPVTSIFVHWFVGTGYMFHFALFVSMCRKIMRKGVLYFIRDPDDPEFHPVRDVLERNVTTQLRKILFSAFVYGALVLVCLGGVVWGLCLSLPKVLPIHYSSNEPVLEFPIDLLFYNFLMPLAIRFFRPHNGLHAMYTWWFRRCARVLRITWFLFGERRVDEEGHLALKDDSPDHNLPIWRRLFLEVDAHGQVVARTWRDILEGGKAKPRPSIPADQMMILNLRKRSLVDSGQLIPDGRFVRTPASDQVKIPKGRNVFLDVGENDTRLDRTTDTDVYSTKQYQFVYVPPHFRARVFFFILFIWIFAAVTGVGITIVPLVFGRWMFKLLIPHHIRTNDIYAFSIGVYLLGSAAYALFHARSIYRAIKARVTAALGSAFQLDAVVRVFGVVFRAAKVVYTYFFVLIVFPLLVASLMELYALIPIHELMYSVLLTENGRKSMESGTVKELNPAHTVRVIQAWTIGLLCLKLSLRILLTWFEGTRLAIAARAIPRRGWLDPDVGILNRAFIVPGLAVWLAAVVTPLLFAKLTVANGLAEAIVQTSGITLADGAPEALYDAYLVLIYRLSFPFIALVILSGITLWSVVGVFRRWQVRIRDEAYLIGERLHNFGATNSVPRPRGAWAGGARI